MGRCQFEYRFRTPQYDFNHLKPCLGKWFQGLGAPQSLDEDNTTLEKSHCTGGMGHISAFPYADFKSWGCKMRSSF